MQKLVCVEKDIASIDNVLEFKTRMLEWPNPVEYVNNMYGCHPGDDGTEYFNEIFRNEYRKKLKSAF